MNVLRRLNNLLLPQDLAKQGPLPKAAAQPGAAPGSKGHLSALEGRPRCVFPAVKRRFAEATDPGAFISLHPTFHNNKLQEAGEFSTPVWNPDKHFLAWFCLLRSSTASWGLSPPRPGSGGETQHRLLEWNSQIKTN